MSWLSADMSMLCRTQSDITSCGHASLLFLTLLTRMFGKSRDNSQAPKFRPGRGKGYHDDEYDFIVVGAGSAGCVLANRLSEVKNWRILLLEAGIEQPYISEVPALAPMLRGSNIDWAFKTKPDPNYCKARRDGRCTLAAGKVMGGSSAINNMNYVRGNPEDYDRWAAMGNDGWSYKQVLPFFLRSENNDNKQVTAGSPKHHSTGGFQSVGWSPHMDANTAALIDAWHELDVNDVDVNGHSQLGVSRLQMTTSRGERASANAAFVRPVRSQRYNLKVVTRARVTRVLIDADTKFAYGVEYFVDGDENPRDAFALKEIVLSAGAVNSPKILMNSGIGPEHDLARNNVTLFNDLKVGYNLQDHVTTDGVLVSLNETATRVGDLKKVEDFFRYLTDKEGPLANVGPLQVGAFLQTKYEHKKRVPDIQYSYDTVNVQDFLKEPGLASEKMKLPLTYYDGIMIRPILLAPHSRGRVRLNLRDPLRGDPYIYPGYFGTPLDLEVLVEGIRRGLDVVNTKAMKDLGARLVVEPLAGCHQHGFNTSEYWQCVATHYTASTYDLVGTCKMGPQFDVDAVVDHTLRVYGVDRLRVVDASIMPTIVRGNTNAPTMMIAEKGAHMIRSDWRVWKVVG